jgi:hypothetical protein
MRRLMGILLLMCFVAIVQTGCGTTDSATVQPGRSIDLQDYKLLRKVHMELGQFIFELNQAIQPPASLSQRSRKVVAIIKKYEHLLPLPSFQAIGPVPVSEKKRLKGSLTLSMMELNHEVDAKDEQGRAVQDLPFAWYPASQYLEATNSLYGLKEFYDYLLKHTLDEGTKINPKDPPEPMDGGMKIFGSNSPHGGVYVNISWDPNIGSVVYRLGGYLEPISTEASVSEIEQRFIIDARVEMQIGDGLVLEGFKG